VTLLTADVPWTELEAVDAHEFIEPEERWDRRDVFVDLARLWVSPAGDLVSPAASFACGEDAVPETPILRLRLLSERRPGDEFLVPAAPECVDPRLGRRFHLARLPARPAPTVEPAKPSTDVRPGATAQPDAPAQEDRATSSPD
jgi:hypothetical protein